MPGQLSQRNHAADRDTVAIDDWHELSVANPTFLLEPLGSECTDLQGLHELTVNGLDAIAALGDRAGGRVVWDMDWLRFDASSGRVRKLSVTDTGTGMTPEQLRQYINQLASSGREQSATGNFGVGAKIAAGSRNPHGLEYRSWHRGQGARVRFKHHADGRWGLEPERWSEGRGHFWRLLEEQEKQGAPGPRRGGLPPIRVPGLGGDRVIERRGTEPRWCYFCTGLVGTNWDSEPRRSVTIAHGILRRQQDTEEG